ncbi:hypothetical protein J6590_036179 [Homalodisca vitripennis]|nr:hypothetical protein J6590_036179 [Homalodisca vitripennis]
MFQNLMGHHRPLSSYTQQESYLKGGFLDQSYAFLTSHYTLGAVIQVFNTFDTAQCENHGSARLVTSVMLDDKNTFSSPRYPYNTLITFDCFTINYLMHRCRGFGTYAQDGKGCESTCPCGDSDQDDAFHNVIHYREEQVPHLDTTDVIMVVGRAGERLHLARTIVLVVFMSYSRFYVEN